MNSIGIKVYKNPLSNQYVAPYGYSFYYNGINQGRVIWTASPEGYYIAKDKDEELDIIVELEDETDTD